MSTRCVVKITVGESRKQYYHHYDGYLSGVGYELFSRYAMFYEGSRFGEWYAEWRVTKTSQDCNPSKDIDCSYEPEEWGTMHDDIEFLYELDFNQETFKATDLESGVTYQFADIIRELAEDIRKLLKSKLSNSDERLLLWAHNHKI